MQTSGSRWLLPAWKQTPRGGGFSERALTERVPFPGLPESGRCLCASPAVPAGHCIPLVRAGDTRETFTIVLCGEDKEDRKGLFMVAGSSKQLFMF